MENHRPSRTISWFLIIVFLLFIAGIFITGFLFYRTQQQRIKMEAHKNLAAIADLKVGQITRWRDERMGDAKIIYDNVLLAHQVAAYFKTPKKTEFKQDILRWLKSFQENLGYYSIFMIDSKGVVHFSVSGLNDSLGLHAREFLNEALQYRKIIFSDLHQSETSLPVHIDMVVPLFLLDQKDTSVIGAMLLRIDPNNLLFPLIQSWPTPSRTSETLLLEQCGEEVVFLNELRHRKNTTLNLRLPLSNEQLPASMAIRGIEGVVEGIDYRGVPVLAAIRRVPNSPWYMNAKVDQEEVYESLRSQAWIVGSGMFLLILVTGSTIGFWWRHQHARFYRERLLAEHERQALVKHFDYIIKYANDIILLINMDGRIIEANDQACRAYGYKREELHRLYVRDLRSPKFHSLIDKQMKQVEERGGLVFETEHLRKDGTVFPVEISSRFVKIDEVRFYQSIIRDITDRKLVELALRESERRLSLHIQQTPLAFIEWDTNFHVIKWNPAAEKIFGYAVGEAIGQHVGFITPEKFKDHINRMWNDLLAQRGGYRSSNENVTKDRRTIFTEWYNTPLTNSDGEIIGVASIVEDVSERKHAEEAIRENEERFRRIFEEGPVGMVTSNSDFRFIKANTAFCKMTGYEEHELTSLTFKEITHPEDLAKDMEGIKRLLREEVSNYRTEKRYIRKDKKNVWGSITLSAIRNENKQFLYFLAMIEDITERKQAEEAIYKSEERFRNLADLLPQTIFEVDEKGNLTFVNRQGFSTFGYTEEDFARGLNIVQMIHPQDRDRAFENMRRRFRGEELGVQEYTAVRKDGITFPINLYANRIIQDNKPVGLSGLVIDITERKRSEEALQESEERFRRLVESVTDYIYSVKLEKGQPLTTIHSPACVSVTGYTSEEYSADPDLWYRMVHEDDKQIVKSLTAKVLSGFDVLPLEHRIIHKNGYVRWVRNTPVVKRDENGVLIAFDGLIEDITMQKQADEALLESEETAQALLNAPNEAIYLLDTNRKVLALNETGAQRFGKTTNELVGVCIDDLFPPELAESRKKLIDEVIRSPKALHFEDERMGRYLENSFYPIYDIHGSVSRIAVFSRDVTERIQAQEALKKSEDRFRRLSENAVDLIYRYEFIPERRFTYVSPAARTITGYTPEEHYGDPDLGLKLVHPTDRSKLETVTYDKQLPLEPLVLRWIKKDGTVIWTEQRNVPIYNDSGDLIAIEGIARDITDRKRIEDTIRQEGSFRNKIIRSVTEGLCVCHQVPNNPFLAFTVWNDRMTEITGYTMEEINRLGWYQTVFTDPEVRERAIKRMERARIGDDLHAEEWIISRADGQKRTLSIFTTVLETNTAAVHVMIMMQDITERKRAEEALRQSESLFKMLVESSPVAIAVFSGPAKKLEYVSFRFRELFGYEVKDVLSMDAWWQLAYPVEEYRDQIETKWCELVEEAQRGGSEIEPMESVITCQDGSTKYIESTFTSMSEQTLVFFADLTQRRAAEEAFRQTHAFNELLIQTMPFGMDIVDEEGKILFMSKAMKDMLGADVTDKCCWQAYKDDKQQCADCPLRGGIAFGKPEIIETTGVFGGKTYQISHVGMMYKGQKAMLEVFQDITEQKKLQQELIQSQKLLSIGTMAGGIAHDFNNILAIILGYSSILQSIKDHPQRFSDGVTAIRQAVDRGAGLVRQILTFARKTDVSFEPLNVSELIEELVSMLQQTFSKLITFNISLDKHLPYINADHTQIHQALLNLCVNARDAMPNGGEISIKTEAISGDKLRERFPSANISWYLCIFVADTGMGMDETISNRIFDPFFTTKEKGRGTGLGLSVVYGIVQAHHGFIDVKSTLGRGTAFHLYFPVPQESTVTLEAQSQAVEQIAGGSETILFVEDEILLIDMVQILLESNGYTVLTAKDGEEAVEVYRQHAHDIELVISDMGLPKLTGMAEFEKLKEINPHVKIIFASGYFEPDMKTTLENAGAKGFLQKPYVIEDILYKIRNVLDKK